MYIDSYCYFTVTVQIHKNDLRGSRLGKTSLKQGQYSTNCQNIFSDNFQHTTLMMYFESYWLLYSNRQNTVNYEEYDGNILKFCVI